MQVRVKAESRSTGVMEGIRRGLSLFCLGVILLSCFSLSGFLSSGRCPIEFTGDRCQHFAMVSFSSMSLSTSLSPWLL